jgi:acyl carrier protein
MALTKETLIALIDELSGAGLPAEMLAEHPELLSGGVIDSMALLSVVEKLEAALGKRVPPSDITMENFNSVGAILALQNRLLAA